MAELLNAGVSWDSDTQTATIRKDEVSVVLKVGSKTAVVQGKKKDIPAAPVVIDNRIYVPVRAISEALGFRVVYKQESNAVYIYT